MAYATRRSYAGAAPSCTLTNNIASGDTSASLTGDTTNWPSTATGPFYMVIDPGLATEEKVLVTARSTGSLSSITRGVDGTVASAHNAGATCYPVFTAVDADQANKVASTLTTKGDLLVTDGSALNRLAVGTNDYALLADSSATNGVKWAQIPAAGLATDSVTTAKIQDGAVTSAKLSATAAIQPTIVDAKGDLIAGTGSDTVSRLAVGTNGYFLKADSAQSTGLTWAAVPQYPDLVAYGSATGGSSSSITVNSINYTLLTFTSTANLTVGTAGFFDFVLVGAGGSGGAGVASASWSYGNWAGAGGGGGEVRFYSMYVPAGTYSIAIGTGGAASGLQGEATFITALGIHAMGGGGGAGSKGVPYSPQYGGGCGGGASSWDAGVGFGYKGAASSVTSYGGGGGGAGGAASTSSGGAGFDVSIWIGGSTTLKGAGGAGGTSGTTGSSGTANSGNGGQGGGYGGGNGGAGGSGIAYVRFRV